MYYVCIETNLAVNIMSKLSMVINITKKRAFITKSRSGHYSVTVKEYGTSCIDGVSVFPYAEVTFRAGNLELSAAQHLAAEHTK